MFLSVIIFGIVVMVLWKRRKLTFTKFLNNDGKWTEIGHYKIGNNFDYDGKIYEFDIKKCTRDKINRPIAHYYIGNPKQQIFNYENQDKIIEIGTENINSQDFINILKTKIISEIFNDEETARMLLFILFAVIGSFLILGAIIMFKNNPVSLKADNETLSLIAQGCRMGLMRN
jgi:hypothetical protein